MVRPLQATLAFCLRSSSIMSRCQSEDLKPCLAGPSASQPFSILRIWLSRILFLFLRLLLNRPPGPLRCVLTGQSRTVEYGLHSSPAIPLALISSFLILAACSRDLCVPSLSLPISFLSPFRRTCGMKAAPAGSL